MNNGIIFCTSLIEKDTVQKYTNWISYYSKMFPDYDLLLVNDGPISSDFFSTELNKDIKTMSFDKKLGRLTNDSFPGWKRSFRDGLSFCNNNYTNVIFLESDFYIRRNYVEKYKFLFENRGYFVGWAPKYNCIETSFQILNDKDTNKEIIKLLEKETELYRSDYNIEQQINRMFSFDVLYGGDRIENMPYGTLYKNKENYEYFAQFDYNLMEECL